MRRDMVQIFIHWPFGPLPVRTVHPILNIQSQMQAIEPAILGRFNAELRHVLFFRSRRYKFPDHPLASCQWGLCIKNVVGVPIPNQDSKSAIRSMTFHANIRQNRQFFGAAPVDRGIACTILRIISVWQ
jgi:hypothetical protein